MELREATAPLARYAEDLAGDMLLITVGGKPTYALVPLEAMDGLRLTDEAKARLTAEVAATPAAASPATNGTAAGNDTPVRIYTDGGCVGNPGRGGYGAVILEGERREEVQGGFRHTTNNRMEIMGAIEALARLPGRRKVTLYSDSQYLVNAMSKGWAKRWRAKGWMRTSTDAALNPDLWQRLLDLAEKHDVRFEWVPGHAGNPENERAHTLSVEATRARSLPADEGYRS
ncbi:MAG: ribonuclease HI [Anaerolineae bacterium]